MTTLQKSIDHKMRCRGAYVDRDTFSGKYVLFTAAGTLEMTLRRDTARAVLGVGDVRQYRLGGARGMRFRFINSAAESTGKDA